MEEIEGRGWVLCCAIAKELHASCSRLAQFRLVEKWYALGTSR